MARGLDTLTGATRAAWLAFDRKLASEGRRMPTRVHYLDALAQLAEYLGDVQAVDATTDDIRGFLAWMQEPVNVRAGRPAPRYAPSTVANRYRGLCAFYRFTEDEGLSDVNPMAKVKSVSATAAPVAVLTDSQLAALIGNCGKDRDGKAIRPRDRSAESLRDEVILRVFCEFGSPRLFELAALNVEDIDSELEVIRIADGKGGLPRVIPASADTLTAFARYLRASGNRANGPAFLTLRGRTGSGQRVTKSGLAQMIKRRGRAAGIPELHPHMLRHTAFSAFDAATGGNVNAAMALFGWRGPEMAFHYGKAARATKALELGRTLNRGASLRG